MLLVDLTNDAGVFSLNALPTLNFLFNLLLQGVQVFLMSLSCFFLLLDERFNDVVSLFNKKNCVNEGSAKKNLRSIQPEK